MNRLLRRKEVEQMVSLSRASIYRLADLGAFPRPVKVGPRAVRWRLGDIEQWISERPLTNQNRGEVSERVRREPASTSVGRPRTSDN